MVEYSDVFAERKILEWRKKYLRYKLLENQAKAIIETKVWEAPSTGVHIDANATAQEGDPKCFKGDANVPTSALGDNLTVKTAHAPPETTPTKILQMTVILAQNLPKMDLMGSCDAFCKIDFCGRQHLTSVKKDSLSPEWNETFDFDVTTDCTDLCIKIFDWESILDSDYIGLHRIPSHVMAELCAREPGWKATLTGKITDGEGMQVVGADDLDMQVVFSLHLFEASLSCACEERTILVGKDKATEARATVPVWRYWLDAAQCVARRAEAAFFDSLNEDLASIAEFQCRILYQ